MIARISILLLLMLLLSHLYVDRHFLRRRKGKWSRLVIAGPTAAMMIWTVVLVADHDFVPKDMAMMNIFFFLIGLIFVPKATFALCSSVGYLFRKLVHSRYNWGNLAGFFCAIIVLSIHLYGSLVGPRELKVRRVDISVADLPVSFDGYRIVLFSDAHVGTFTGRLRSVLQRDVDSINAQQPDAIMFAGDLQNVEPSELYPVQDMLRSLHAKDGIFSVLGNHDYSYYSHGDPAVKAANERELVSRERQFGWTLLRNEHVGIQRNGETLVIAGEEYWEPYSGKTKADLGKTLDGIPDNACVILLQHNPSAWRSHILPNSDVQLTLCGHTHGGQLSLFGVRASRIRHREDHGLYREGNRHLYVTCGIGGVVPFRFGVSPEIAVITLHTKHQ